MVVHGETPSQEMLDRMARSVEQPDATISQTMTSESTTEAVCDADLRDGTCGRLRDFHCDDSSHLLGHDCRLWHHAFKPREEPEDELSEVEEHAYVHAEGWQHIYNEEHKRVVELEDALEKAAKRIHQNHAHDTTPLGVSFNQCPSIECERNRRALTPSPEEDNE